MLKVLLKVIGVLVIIIIIISLFLYYVIYYAPMVPKDYTKKVITGGEIEKKYLLSGEYKVKSIKKKVEKPVDKYVIYYPNELEDSNKKYPVVLIVNGTGVFANKEKALIKHLASWGFIVVGNYDPSTFSGESTDMTLNYLLELNKDENSIFYNKVDTENIGITGHSQGGVGVFNTINNTEHKNLYKCAVSISPTEYETAKILKMNYEYKETKIPLFLLAGTNNDVIKIENLEKMYEEINSTKVMAIKKNTNHGEMLYSSDGYVTAWFMWHLQNDTYAKNAFVGDNAELLNNNMYQNQKINILN